MIGAAGVLLAISATTSWVRVVFLGDLTLSQLLALTHHSRAIAWAPVGLGVFIAIVGFAALDAGQWMRAFGNGAAIVIAVTAGPGTYRLVSLVSASHGFAAIGPGVVLAGFSEALLIAGAAQPRNSETYGYQPSPHPAPGRFPAPSLTDPSRSPATRPSAGRYTDPSEDPDQRWDGRSWTAKPHRSAPASASDWGYVPTDPTFSSHRDLQAAANDEAGRGSEPRVGSGRRRAVAIAVGVVVVIAVGVLAFVVGRTTKKSSVTTTPTTALVLTPPPTEAPPPVVATPTAPVTAALAPTAPTAPTAQTAPMATTDPAAIVEAYFSAVAQHDYQQAWDLGGRNLVSSYQAFVAGYAATDHAQLTVIGENGSEVDVQVTAYEYDASGGQQTSWYDGSYQVSGGVITSGHLILGSRSTGW
jgi:hypothetical protein